MTILGLSGSFHRPSRTTALVQQVLASAREAHDASTDLLEISDVAAALGRALDPRNLPTPVLEAFERVRGAEALVIATPVYKASYTGLLKHFLDLLEPSALAGKPVILAATAGGPQHALVIEHQLRPLLGFFGAATVATGIYALDADFTGGSESAGYRLANPQVQQRIDQALDQAFALTVAGRVTPALAPRPALRAAV